MEEQYEITIRSRTALQRVDRPGLSLGELAELCGCPHELAAWLVDAEVLRPLDFFPRPLFDDAAVYRLRRALRLKRDLGLNVNALAVVMELLDRIEELEGRLRRM